VYDPDELDELDELEELDDVGGLNIRFTAFIFLSNSCTNSAILGLILLKIKL
jgi:hypothetical protein